MTNKEQLQNQQQLQQQKISRFAFAPAFGRVGVASLRSLDAGLKPRSTSSETNDKSNSDDNDKSNGKSKYRDSSLRSE
jgi:hypothetical protein